MRNRLLMLGGLLLAACSFPSAAAAPPDPVPMMSFEPKPAPVDDLATAAIAQSFAIARFAFLSDCAPATAAPAPDPAELAKDLTYTSNAKTFARMSEVMRSGKSPRARTLRYDRDLAFERRQFRT